MSEEARFELRHGTQDTDVFNEVLVNNQYKLADKISSNALIIDIGANIGCFAAACLLRGAGTVVCFEPGNDNFRQLATNLSPWPGQFVAVLAGVWRSDVEQAVAFSSNNGSASCCCFPIDLVDHNESRVNAIGLDDILLQCTNNGERRVQLLKIDAEYSEYPILFTSKRLDLVDEVIGETHEFHGGCELRDEYYNHPTYKNTAADIHRFLRDQGFVVNAKQECFDNQINCLFWAVRPSPETTSDPS